MDAVTRGAAVYLLLLIIFRLAGRRTLAQMTNFDFVLLLIISEATQNAMIGEDYSVTNGALVVLTLVGLDVLLSHVKRWSEAAEMWLDGKPTIIVEQGRPKTETMQRARIDEDDVLMATPCSKRAEASQSFRGDYMPLTIFPVSASTRRRRDSFPVSTISMS